MNYKNTTELTFTFADLSVVLKGGDVSADIPDNLVKQSATFMRFIEKGFLVPVDQKPTYMKNAQVLSAATTGLDSSDQLDQSKVIVAHPEANQEPFRATPPTSVSAIEPVKPAQDPQVVSASNEDLGSFVTKNGLNPVGASERTTQQFLENESMRLTHSADALLRAGLPERFPKSAEDDKKQDLTQIPEELQEWFTMRHTQKKFVILTNSDKPFLESIKKYDENVKIKSLIEQRIAEITTKPHVEKNAEALIKFNIVNRNV